MANEESPVSSLQSPILKRVYRRLARLDLAAIAMLIVLFVAAIGSCFPQLSPSVAADAEQLARWEAVVRDRYGALTDLLLASGAFRCFHAPVFLVPLVLLVVATLVCMLDRWQRVWWRAFHRPVRCSRVALDSAPHTAGLTAPPEVDLPAIVRERLERRGFHVRTTEVVTADCRLVYLRGDRNRSAPLATLVTHLGVLLLMVGVVLSSGFGWREEMAIGPGETVEVGRATGLALRNEAFTVVHYPDGSVAGYEAQVAVVEGQREVMHGCIRVNEPLTYDGIGFHLHGYEGIEERYSITLLVVRDPGYGPVVAAGFLLLLGMTVSFNFPHCWVHARVDPEGALHLAGRADRRAYGFGREFAALVEEIRHEPCESCA
jgi:cytochrome c biogenesis protein ResB